MAIQKKISRENLRAFKGRTETALIEGPSKDNPLVWEARLEGMAPDIDGKIYLTDIEVPGGGEMAATGDAARVEITKTDAYDLIGRVVEILPRPHGARTRCSRSERLRDLLLAETLTAHLHRRSAARLGVVLILSCNADARFARRRPIRRQTPNFRFAASGAACRTSAIGRRRNMSCRSRSLTKR